MILRQLRILGTFHNIALAVGAFMLLALTLGRDPMWHFDTVIALDNYAFELALYGPLVCGIGAHVGQRAGRLQWMAIGNDRRLLIGMFGSSLVCVLGVYLIGAVGVALAATLLTGAPLVPGEGVAPVMAVAILAVVGFHAFGFALGTRYRAKPLAALVAVAVFGLTILALGIGLGHMVTFGRLLGGERPSLKGHMARTAFSLGLLAASAVGVRRSMARPGAILIVAGILPLIVVGGVRAAGNNDVAVPVEQQLTCSDSDPVICVATRSKRYLPTLVAWSNNPEVTGYRQAARALPFYKVPVIERVNPYYGYKPSEMIPESEAGAKDMIKVELLLGLAPFCLGPERFLDLQQGPYATAAYGIRAFLDASIGLIPPQEVTKQLDGHRRVFSPPNEETAPAINDLVRSLPEPEHLTLSDPKGIAWLRMAVSVFDPC